MIAFGFLIFWDISEKFSLLLDHKLILLYWKNIDVSLSFSNLGKVTRRNVQDFIQNKNQLNKTKKI